MPNCSHGRLGRSQAPSSVERCGIVLMRANHVLRPAPQIAATFAFLVGPLACAPAAAQARKHPSASVTILEDPATAAFRKALNSISPGLAAATRWRQSDRNEAGAETAASVAIDVPWNESRIVADKLTIAPHESRSRARASRTARAPSGREDIRARRRVSISCRLRLRRGRDEGSHGTRRRQAPAAARCRSRTSSSPRSRTSGAEPPFPPPGPADRSRRRPALHNGQGPRTGATFSPSPASTQRSWRAIVFRR